MLKSDHWYYASLSKANANSLYVVFLKLMSVEHPQDLTDTLLHQVFSSTIPLVYASLHILLEYEWDGSLTRYHTLIQFTQLEFFDDHAQLFQQ